MVNENNSNIKMQPEEWFYTSLPLPIIPDLKKKSSLNFTEAFAPFSYPYYSKFIPFFSAQLSKASVVNEYDIVTIRDGIIPLLWFFYTQTKLIKSETFFLVNHKFVNLIPSNWFDNTALYSVINSKTRFPKRKKLIINGEFFLHYTTKSYIDDFIKKIKSIVFKKDISIELYVTTFGKTEYQKQFNYFISKIPKKIEKIWEYDEINRLKHIPNCFTDYYLINFNQNFFYSDSYLDHFFLKKGAFLIDEIPLDTKLYDVVTHPLSPQHELQIATDVKHDDNNQLIEELFHNISILIDKDFIKKCRTSNQWCPPVFTQYVFEYLTDQDNLIPKFY